MAAKSTAASQGFLRLFLRNEDFTGLGDAGGLRGSVVAGSVYITLHTGDPGVGGTQSTFEISYTGWSRVAVARSTLAWNSSGDEISNASAITFPLNSGGTSPVATWATVGLDAAGAGIYLWRGPLSPNLPCNAGTSPGLPAGAIVITEV